MQKTWVVSLIFLFSSFLSANNEVAKENVSSANVKAVSPKEALENYNKTVHGRMPSFGPTKGLVVEQVEPGSVFEKLGLKSGDNIISYDSRALKSPKDGVDFYKKAEKRQVKIMLIERNGEQRNLYVK
jgi:type II secretory pathway component PulC